MTDENKYPFSDLTQAQIDAIITRARVERAQAIGLFFTSLFTRRPRPEASLAEFATRVPARVSPC